MKRLLAISLVILVITPATLRGQADDILFSGNYQDVPFGEFVNDVEQKTGVTFYYLERWVRGVRVTASGDEISLRNATNSAGMCSSASLENSIIRSGSPCITAMRAWMAALPPTKVSSASNWSSRSRYAPASSKRPAWVKVQA